MTSLTTKTTVMAGAFGVHFGSTSSCVAVCKDGKTDVIANDAGDRVTPAVVAFTDVEQLVGLSALQQISRNLSNTICNVKQLLGHKFAHATVEAAVGGGPVKIINKDDKPAYSVTFKEKPAVIDTVEIAKIILQKMKETAESHGGVAKSHNTVLSVPLSFDEEQRASLRLSASMAGFNVLRLISEPSAALLAYGIGQQDTSETWNVMVVRIGGQSSAVAVVSVNSGMYRVLASVESSDVGGHQINDILVEHFAAEFQRQYKVNCRENARAVSKLQAAAESCKRVLSTMNTAQCSIDSLHEGMDFNSTLSRSFVQNCLQPLESCLDKAHLKREDIHKVILCGGCCRIPLLQQQIQEYFQSAECLQHIAPDEVIAVGCAIEAAILAGKDQVELDQFANACEMPCLSAEILVQINGDKDNMKVALAPFTPIPVRRQKTFTLESGVTSATVDVLQRIRGSGELLQLAQLSLPELPEGSSLNVVFHVRHDGCLHVTCSEPTSNKSQDVLIEGSS